VDASTCIWMWLAATFLFGKHGFSEERWIH
jgi:hypothetical protein